MHLPLRTLAAVALAHSEVAVALADRAWSRGSSLYLALFGSGRRPIKGNGSQFEPVWFTARTVRRTPRVSPPYRTCRWVEPNVIKRRPITDSNVTALIHVQPDDEGI